MSFRPVSDPKNNLDRASESDWQEIYLKPITSVPGAAVYGQYTAHLQGLTKMSRIIAVSSRYAEFKRVPELDQDEQHSIPNSILHSCCSCNLPETNYISSNLTELQTATKQPCIDTYITTNIDTYISTYIPTYEPQLRSSSFLGFPNFPSGFKAVSMFFFSLVWI